MKKLEKKESPKKVYRKYIMVLPQERHYAKKKIKLYLVNVFDLICKEIKKKIKLIFTFFPFYFSFNNSI